MWRSVSSAVRWRFCAVTFAALPAIMFRTLFCACSWCTVAALGGPTINVIAEGPRASADTSGQALRTAAAQIQNFAASVRDETRRMSASAKRAVDAQSAALASSRARRGAPVAGFVSIGDAESDSDLLASMLRGASGHVGGAHPGPAPAEEAAAMPEIDASLRNLLLSAGKKFADIANQEQSVPASFLQPVDANRLRKSLAATEPMRPSPAMILNVVSAEDVPAMRQEAVYKGLAAQTKALHDEFAAGVAALGAP